MDAITQLALMTKAKMVFETGETFLSFPALSPVSYPPDRLRFAGPGGIASAQDLNDLSEFSRMTNRIPRGTLAPITEDEYLWDICAEALATAEVASGSLSPEGQARLDAALALLYVADADGRRQDSPALVAYKQCRDASIVAAQEYANRKLTAENSDDPDVKDRWSRTDEPALRAEIDRIESEWLTAGNKGPVEEAMLIEQSFAAREPSLTLAKWRSAFLDDIDLQTDTNQINFAPTGFAPYDLFEHGPWPRFTLTGSEIPQLVSQAPPELKEIFGANLDHPDIESVSFEYRSVALTRHWLPKRLFDSGFWRLGASGGEMSDGGTPPKGRCPAYVTALVFARNVQVRRRQAPEQSVAPRPGTLLALDRALVPANSLSMRLAVEPQPPKAPGGSAAPVARLLQQRTSLEGVAAPASGASNMLRRTMQVTPSTVLRSRAAAVPAAAFSAAAAAGPIVRDHRANVVVRDHRTNRPPVVTRPSLPPRPVVVAPVPQPPPVVTEPGTAPDEVLILAFVCRPLQRWPNPDPSLSWS